MRTKGIFEFTVLFDPSINYKKEKFPGKSFENGFEIYLYKSVYKFSYRVNRRQRLFKEWKRNIMRMNKKEKWDSWRRLPDN